MEVGAEKRVIRIKIHHPVDDSVAIPLCKVLSMYELHYTTYHTEKDGINFARPHVFERNPSRDYDWKVHVFWYTQYYHICNKGTCLIVSCSVYCLLLLLALLLIIETIVSLGQNSTYCSSPSIWPKNGW